MFNKGVLVLALVGVALAAPSDPYHQPSYKEEPKPYQFAYGVKDEYAGTDFGQSEESDGKAVKGSYTVQLPDGRKQTVNYVADHYNGYQAEVSYYGEAQYPTSTVPHHLQAPGLPPPAFLQATAFIPLNSITMSNNLSHWVRRPQFRQHWSTPLCNI
nr:cuticle protein 7-like [Penaeus vannamei]